jgi:hypothetical protein
MKKASGEMLINSGVGLIAKGRLEYLSYVKIMPYR